MRKLFHSVFFKTFIITAVLIIASFLFLGIVVITSAGRYFDNVRKAELEKYANNTAHMAGANVYGDRLNVTLDLMFFITTIARSTDTLIFISDTRGDILAASGLNASLEGQTIPSDLMALAEKGEKLPVSNFGRLFDAPQIAVVRPVMTRQGHVVGYLYLATPSSQPSTLSGSFFRMYALIALFVLFVSCSAAYFLTSRMTQPMKKMAQAAVRFSRGAFDVRVEVDRGSQEMEELSTAFNAMADALQKADALRSDFIANVSHELKTPMTVISGFITGIQDGTIPPDRQEKSLETVRLEVLRLSRLVSRMLDIARLQSESPNANAVTFDVRELLLQTLLSFEAAVEARGIEVKLDLPEEAVPVWGDPDAVTQVIYNLLENAVKHTPPGRAIGLTLVKKGNRRFITVRNEGDPIPAEEWPYVFDRFHKADRSRGMDPSGLGLGLYIVKTILGHMNEDVWVHSDENGTNFTFSLSQRQ